MKFSQNGNKPQPSFFDQIFGNIRSQRRNLWSQTIYLIICFLKRKISKTKKKKENCRSCLPINDCVFELTVKAKRKICKWLCSCVQFPQQHAKRIDVARLSVAKTRIKNFRSKPTRLINSTLFMSAT